MENKVYGKRSAGDVKLDVIVFQRVKFEASPTRTGKFSETKKLSDIIFQQLHEPPRSTMSVANVGDERCYSSTT
jgi:hypothetical protein